MAALNDDECVDIRCDVGGDKHDAMYQILDLFIFLDDQSSFTLLCYDYSVGAISNSIG